MSTTPQSMPDTPTALPDTPAAMPDSNAPSSTTVASDYSFTVRISRKSQPWTPNP